jgi:hypothetical protein
MKTQNSFFTIAYEFSCHQKIYLVSPNGSKVDLILMITEDIGPACVPPSPSAPQDGLSNAQTMSTSMACAIGPSVNPKIWKLNM